MKNRQKISHIDRIRLVQQALVYAGYIVAIDGDYGNQTKKAIIRFKSDNSLPANDALSQDVVQLLLVKAAKVFSQSYKNSWLEPDLSDIPTNLVAAIFPRADAGYVADVFAEVNQRKDLYQLNSVLRKSHSLAQVRSEVGARFSVTENLNYKTSALSSLFRIYRQNPNLAESHGRNSRHAADQEAIANHAYANRIGNGGVSSGDGWKFRGRGIKALTGRSNYRAFTIWHNKTFTGDNVNFEKSPELLEEPIYAARSGCFFWVDHDLHLIADRGATSKTVNAITHVINRHLPADRKAKRVQHFNKIWGLMS